MDEEGHSDQRVDAGFLANGVATDERGRLEGGEPIALRAGSIDGFLFFAADPPASSRSRRYPYPQNVLLAAFGTPSPYYRTRRTFLYHLPHCGTTATSALSYYYGGEARDLPSAGRLRSAIRASTL